MTDEDLQKKVEQLKAELKQREELSERELEIELRQAFRESALSLFRREDYYYILEDEQVVSVDAARWSARMEFHYHERIVARTVVQEGVEVSTVFLALDHNYDETGPPILFETLVFGGLLDQEMVRYATLAEAREGHWAMVNRVQRAEGGEAL
jgi:hypothetical protein